MNETQAKYRVFTDLEGESEVYSSSRIGEIAAVASNVIAEFDSDGDFVCAYETSGDQAKCINADVAMRTALREGGRLNLSTLKEIFAAGAIEFLSQCDRIDGFVESDGSNLRVYTFEEKVEIEDDEQLRTIEDAIDNREGGEESFGVVRYSNVFQLCGEDCILEQSRFQGCHELYRIRYL